MTTSTQKSVRSVVSSSWHFWNIEAGSYFGGGWTNPVLTTTAQKKNKFRIRNRNKVPLREEDVHARVAIECTTSSGEKSYLSCRRSCPLTDSCLAEWRSTIGEFETFTMSYCALDNSFRFQSHNNYFLYYNETFHSVAFKPVPGRWELLEDNETIDRTGNKDGGTKIATAITFAPLKLAFFPFES